MIKSWQGTKTQEKQVSVENRVTIEKKKKKKKKKKKSTSMLLKLSLQGAYLLIELVFVVVAILRQDVCEEQCCCRYCCFLVFGAGFYTSDGSCCFFIILIALINSRNKNRFHHACFFPISGSVNNPYLVSRVYNRQNQGNNEAIVNCEEVTSCSTHPLISSF